MKRPPPSRFYVYAIGWQVSGPLKIGMTAYPRRRLKQIQTGCPFRLKMLYSAVIDSPDVAAVEAECHRVLRTHRISGEWFTIDLPKAILIIKAATLVLLDRRNAPTDPQEHARSRRKFDALRARAAMDEYQWLRNELR